MASSLESFTSDLQRSLTKCFSALLIIYSKEHPYPTAKHSPTKRKDEAIPVKGMPTFQESELSKAVKDHLFQILSKNKDLYKTTFENILRLKALSLIESTTSVCPFHQLYTLLDLILSCVDQGLCDQTTPFSILEDLIDCLTTEDCYHIFDYLESRREKLIKNMVPNRGKGLILLRFCNELLRRLSKSNNAVFGGRILMFLANVFPLGERSGVNLRGDFNLENTTTFEVSTEKNPKDSNQTSDIEAMEIDQVEAHKKEEGYYCIFWSLQGFFRNPITCFQQKDFDEMKKAVSSTLEKFENLNEVENKSDATTEGRGVKRKRRSEESYKSASFNDPNSHFFFPKFLTSSNLFELELSDPHFRRQILVQLLILCQYLYGFSSLEKDKLQEHFSKNRQLVPNKVLQNPFVLDSSGENWVRSTHRKVLSILEKIPPNPKHFTRTVLHILRLERNWISWKNESCKPFDKPRLVEDKEDIERKIRFHCRPCVIKKSDNSPITFANRELNRLWSIDSDDLGFLSKECRATPSLSSFLEELEEQMDPDHDIEKQYRLSSDTCYVWKALRLASREQFDKYQRVGNDVEALILELKKEERIEKEVEAEGVEEDDGGDLEQENDGGERAAANEIS